MSAIIVQAQDAYVNGQLGLNFAANEKQTLTFQKFRQLMADDPFNFDIVEAFNPSRVLFADVSATDTSIELDAPLSYLDDNDFWVVIDPYTHECEVRKVTALAADAKTCTVAALDYAHSATDIVMLIDRPVVNVKWFGAKGDGSTDDTTALNRAFVQASNLSGTAYIPTGDYITSGQLFAGRLDADANTVRVTNIVGDGMYNSVIHPQFTGGHALILVGSHLCTYRDFAIHADNASLTPTTGILKARNSAGDSAGFGRFHRVRVKGAFTDACLYSYGSEENLYVDCHFEAGPSVKAAVIVSGTNQEAVTLSYTGLTLATGTQSNNSNRFIGCRFQHDNADYASLLGLLCIERATSVHARDSYFNYTGSGTAGEGVYIYGDSNCNNIAIENNIFHGDEMAYHLHVALTGNLYVNSLRWIDNGNGINAGTNAVLLDSTARIAGTSHIEIEKTTFLEGSVNFQGPVFDDCEVHARVITVGGVFEGRIYTDNNSAASLTISDTDDFYGSVYYEDIGRWVAPVKTLAEASNPSVRRGDVFVTPNANVRDITTFGYSEAVDGTKITVLFIHDNKEVVFNTGDGSHNNLYGNGGVNWFPSAGDHMTCTFYNGNWYCVVSDNTA